MKVTVGLLAILVCFFAVNAELSEQFDPLDSFVDEAFPDELCEYDARGICKSFFWYLKAALRTLKGVNCTIKEVTAIKAASQDFIDKLQACGDDAVKAFKSVIADLQSVITICNNIIHLNERVCKDHEDTNEKSRTPFSCFVKLLRQLLKLRRQINKTLRAIKNVPTIPAQTAACSDKAVSELTTAFTSFPENVKKCSKLTK